MRKISFWSYMSVTHHYDSNRESAKNLVPPIKKILKGILIQELQIFYTVVEVLWTRKS